MLPSPRKAGAQRTRMPSSSPQVKATKAKFAAVQPLAPSNAANVQGGKALEEIYQKKSQLEHIL